jgi:hypothetical protein
MTILRGLVIAGLLGGLVVAAGAGAQARRIGFRSVDVEGRRVDTHAWRGRRAAIVSFTSREAKDATQRLLTRVDDATLSDGALETVLIADVRAYDAFPMRGFAEGALESGMADGLRERRARRRAASADVSTAQRFRMVADWNGALLRAFGVRSVGSEPITFVLDRRGIASAPIRGASAAAARRIIAAVEASRPVLAPIVASAR